MFVVQVAADVFGSKTNFELSFAARPSVTELTRATEVAFSNDISLRRPEGVPQHSFHLSKFKIYDEDRNKWVDLHSDSQLSEFCQLYAFQPENPWHKETQKEIPPAVKPPAPSTVASRLQSASSRPQPLPPALAPAYASSAPRGPSKSAAAFVPSASVDATDDEKIRTVFAEFDVKNLRMIELEDLKQGFRTLGIDFTTATLNDLFQKGDANNDGRISYSEFERFAHWYPIMIDCLFYRSRAFWDDQNMQKDIDLEKDSVRQASLLVQQAEAAHKAAQKAIDDTQSQILEADGDIKDRGSRVRDLQGLMEQALRDKERAQKEKYDRENDAAAVRDRERAARQTFTDVARESEKVDRRVALLQQDSAKADERVRQLQAQLDEAKRQAERAAQATKQGQLDLEAIKAKERDAGKSVETAAREVPRTDEALRQADTNLGVTLDRIRELEMLQRDMVREQEEASRRRDAAERAAQAAKEHEQRMGEEVLTARRNAEERERAARAREAELLEQQRQRQLISQHERALIEQELRLREQRDSLEEKETKLKTEASSVLSSLRAALAQPRGTSASGYQRSDSASYQRATY